MPISANIQSIYTDGACTGNPGPGGWAAVVYFTDGSLHEIGGSAAQTTNNRMEMQAAIAALQLIAESSHPSAVTIHTDSEYLINGVTKWVKGWKKKGWKTAEGKPVLNDTFAVMLVLLVTSAVTRSPVLSLVGNHLICSSNPPPTPKLPALQIFSPLYQK